jgi:uncharacterized protein YbjT (DUF2867 family)
LSSAALARKRGQNKRKCGNNLFVREVLEVLEVDMKIGVSGASGHLGRAVVSELLQRSDGHEIVAITRTPETVSGPAQGRFGDYNRPESLAEAYAGLDRLLIIPTLDPEPGKQGAQNVAAIDAAVRAGIKHMVFTSAAGTRQEEKPALGASYCAGLTRAGVPVEVVNIVISIQASFAAGAFDIVTGDVERLGGRPPKPLRDVLAAALKSPSAAAGQAAGAGQSAGARDDA